MGERFVRSSEEIQKWIVQWLSSWLKCRLTDVDPQCTFAKSGLSSVGLVRMLGDLEELIEIDIDVSVAFQWPTPQALARGLLRGAAERTPAAVSTPDVGGHVAVVGMACRFPGGADSPAAFWHNLATGVDAVAEVPGERWDVDKYFDPDRGVPGASYTRRGAFLSDVAGFDAEFFGLTPQEALRTDPQQRLLMELVWEATEDAALTGPALRRGSTGLVVGLMDTGQYIHVQMDSQGDSCLADPYFAMGSAASVAAGRIAHFLDLRGPSYTVDTACSSGLVAVHLAAQALLRGECDVAMAAGVSLNVHPNSYLHACSMSMLSPDGPCKTFDERADGFAMGEGGGVVVLKRLSDAKRDGNRIRAVLLGSATNQDGRTNGLTAPNPAAQAAVIRDALAVAGMTPSDVGFVEAHGSGTSLGDAVELAALHEVFGSRPATDPLLVGAVKTNIGHTLAGAGMAGFVKAVLALENDVVPPNLHFEQPSDAIPEDGTIRPVSALTSLATGVCGVSSFGWSGTNAHVVLKKAPGVAPSAPGRPWQVLTMSASSEQALDAQARRLAESWPSNADLADVAHTTQTGRTPLRVRRSIVCRDAGDAVRRLADPRLLPPSRPARPEAPRVAFLLPGAGDQRAGMGAELYETEPVFAGVIDECAGLLPEADLRAAVLDGVAVPSLAELIGRAEPTSSSDLDRPEIAHPAVFAVEMALIRLLEHWGIRPDLLVGYSLGEYTAACAAGVFTLADAVRIVRYRAELIGGRPVGAMLAVAAGEADTTALLGEAGARATVAAANGPHMTVLSGEAGDITAFSGWLSERGIAARPLRVTHAFHTPSLAPVQDELRAAIAGVRRMPNTIPILSNVTGGPVTPEDVTDPDYWAAHLCRPVRFGDSVRHLDTDVVLEVGPGATLSALVRQNLAGESDADVLTTMPSVVSGESARERLLTSVGALWQLGADVRWDRTHDGRRGHADLPAYPFQRARFWPESGRSRAARRQTAENWCYAPRWERATAAPEPVTGALIVFSDDRTGLVDLARAAGMSVTEVRRGSGFSTNGSTVTIDPGRGDHYRALLERLRPDTPAAIVHAWSLGTRQDAGTEEAMHDAVRLGFDSLLLLVQALGELATVPDVRLLTVSAGSADVVGGDLVAPERSVVHGLGRVIPAEYQRFSWRGVDLDPARADDVGAQLWTELCAESSGARDGVAAWRSGRRWDRTWRRVRMGEETGLWRADAVYLITGGTRGLGMAMAKDAVRAGVRRLALVSRTQLPPRSDWAGMSVGTPGDRTERTVRDVAELVDTGAEVLVLRADAGVPDQMRHALRQTRSHFGRLDGVIHAAGLPGSGAIQRKEMASAAAVLAPKLLGIVPLLELAAHDTPVEERLESLVLFSSSVSVLGGFGESDYCAANTVVDACAASVANGTRVVSVAWGPWQHDDWTAVRSSNQAAMVRDYRARFGFTGASGADVLGRILASGEPNVLALRQPLPELTSFWHRLNDTRGPAPEPDHVQARHRRPSLQVACVLPHTDVERRIAAVWERFLGIEGVGVDDPFFDLGGNSLIGTAMMNALHHELGVSIAPALLFQYPTIAAMARWISAAAGDEDQNANESLLGSRDRGASRRGMRRGGPVSGRTRGVAP